VLLRIGALRMALGLNHGDNWRGDEAADYSFAGAPISSQYAEFKAKLANHADRTAQRQAKIKPAASTPPQYRAGAVAGGAVGAGIASFVGAVWALVLYLVRTAAILAAAGVAIYVFALLLPLSGRDGSSDSSAQPQAVAAGPAIPPPAAPVQPAFSVPPVPPPYSGSMRRFAPGEDIAPFEIKTSAGGNYLVKLEDAYDGSDVMDIFVRGGDTVQVDVPLGTYVVKYASGDTWYGYDYLFGPDTSYSRAESTFAFSQQGYEVSGYTITLYRVVNGNLSTKTISQAEF
jgi:hypothetical protein